MPSHAKNEEKCVRCVRRVVIATLISKLKNWNVCACVRVCVCLCTVCIVRIWLPEILFIVSKHWIRWLNIYLQMRLLLAKLKHLRFDRRRWLFLNPSSRTLVRYCSTSIACAFFASARLPSAPATPNKTNHTFVVCRLIIAFRPILDPDQHRTNGFRRSDRSVVPVQHETFSLRLCCY